MKKQNLFTSNIPSTFASLLIICLLSCLFLLNTTAYGQARSKTSLNQNWKFHLGDPEGNYFQSNTDDSQWENIHVPHTLELTSLTLDGLEDEKTQLVFHRKVGWYRKSLELAANSDKKVFLEFEGAHQVTDLWVNGVHIGQHSIGGYTPFHFDITSFVQRGASNQITLRLDNRRNEEIPPDPGPFDYVKFSGLYRDVYLVETDSLHITFNWEALKAGIYITTPTVDPVNMNASIRVKTVVRNEYATDRDCEVITRIMDKAGIVVLKMSQSETIKAQSEFEFDQIGSIEDKLKLWGIENPYLYRVNSQVLSKGKKIDELENTLGIRKFELDPVRGFVLNNKPLDLIGYNRHQQYPYIGDAVPNALHYKDMLQFKQLGFNIMRTAHYPQDDALIDACDELGILVYEEAPSWISMSTNPVWWDNFEQAARTMIRNHRNHPSIVIWGGGINHRGYVARVHNASKQEDPDRLTASQGSRWTGWQSSGLSDINANMLYGPFIWDRSEPMFAMEGRSGPAEVAKHKRDPLMVGLISWTAHAYYTFHPSHPRAKSKIDRTRSGAMTIFRYPKKGINWYPSEMKEEPYIYIEEDWEASTKQLHVYSNGDEVELSVNGSKIAKQTPSQDTLYRGLEHPPFIFEIDNFQSGKLTAKAISQGKTIAQSSIQTPEEAIAIRIELDTLGRKFQADGSDILLAFAHVVDKNNTTLRNASYNIHFTVTGDASVIGDQAPINANPMFTEFGVAPILIKAGTKASKIEILATAKGLKSGRATVSTVPYNPNMIDIKPIYDFEKVRVDIGSTEQLVQFEWMPWNTTDNEPAQKEFSELGGFTAKISSASGKGVLRYLGEMNVIGKYGYVYGDGVIGVDEAGLKLSFDDLAKGQYKLTTWHHAPKSNSDHMDPNREKLKKLKIDKIPYETSISIHVLGKPTQDPIAVTEGKNMQFEAAATHELIFESDGIHPVEIICKGSTNKGIWLNGFELSQWQGEIE